ncbi:hypothetical protein SUGI_0675440 [Cryptomeria japonica]|nr:hypothetical protein SUGI_0675440 [Cryptomeria japonica]
MTSNWPSNYNYKRCGTQNGDRVTSVEEVIKALFIVKISKEWAGQNFEGRHVRKPVGLDVVACLPHWKKKEISSSSPRMCSQSQCSPRLQCRTSASPRVRNIKNVLLIKGFVPSSPRSPS